MASLKDAEQARVSASETLRELGAHAIAVEEAEPESAPDTDTQTEPADGTDTTDGSRRPSPRRHRKRRSYHVVAYFDKEPPPALPDSLEVKAGTQKHLVPLKARQAPMFEAESAVEARPE